MSANLKRTSADPEPPPGRDPICPDGVERLRLRRTSGPPGAPTLIYLPGLHGDWTMIGAFREALGGAVTWVEMTYPRSPEWQLADYARHIEEQLLQHGIESGWLLGESFGSQVMWELVRRRPQAWQGLILAGGFVRYPVPPFLGMTKRLLEVLPFAWVKRCLPAYVLYARVRHQKSPTARAGAAEFVARRTAADMRAMAQRLTLIAGSDPRETAAGLTIPLHHLYGAIDPIVPWPPVVRWLERNCPTLRGSRRIWASDHTVLATAAQSSAEQVLQWIR